jgi:hypothetical protein
VWQFFFFNPLAALKAAQYLVRDVPKRDQTPVCSVLLSYRGTSDRNWYGVGMDQVLSNSSDDMGGELLGALLRAMFDKEEEIFQVSDLFLTLSVESNEKTSV